GRVVNVELVRRELTAFWIHPFSRRHIELPGVGGTGENVPVELPIGERGLLVRTISLIGTDVAAGQVDEEDEFISHLDISHVTFPEIAESSYRNPLQRCCVLRHRKTPPQNSSATFLPERPFGRAVRLSRRIARARGHLGAANADE